MLGHKSLRLSPLSHCYFAFSLEFTGKGFFLLLPLGRGGESKEIKARYLLLVPGLRYPRHVPVQTAQPRLGVKQGWPQGLPPYREPGGCFCLWRGSGFRDFSIEYDFISGGSRRGGLWDTLEGFFGS